MGAWMIRAGRGGKFASEWLELGIIEIFWNLDGADIAGLGRDEIKRMYARLTPDATPQEVAANAGQVYRFASEMAVGDTIVMYEPAARLYHMGQITGECEWNAAEGDVPAGYVRTVSWEGESSRDSLSKASRNSLGSISTIFSVSDETLADLRGDAGAGAAADSTGDEETSEEVRFATEEAGIERIKDKVALLSWDDMELLVAGLLRAMGYKTFMTGSGADGGRDIVASPDGLGLEQPRIVVEVKHRKAQMGAQEVRSFIGGLRDTDSGLYVSTGGFTREARYEADRATRPIKLLTLDDLVKLLVANYESADHETRAILPLVRIYWPA